MFIRTKDGVYEVDYEIYVEGDTSYYRVEGVNDFSFEQVIKEADTIEELFMPNDLLVVGDDKNQMPIFIESIEYLNAWLWVHDIYHIKEFYIKDGNNFKCVAKSNDKGELELL